MMLDGNTVKNMYTCPLPTPGSPKIISEVCIRKPLLLVGIVKTVAFKHKTFKHPESAIRINSGGILSPAATFSNTPLTHVYINIK